MAAAACLAASPASAQDVSVGPAAGLFSRSRVSRDIPEPEPLALALDLTFGATVWAQVKISTEGPVVSLTRLVRGGFYKQELIELILMSAEAGKPLQRAVGKRRKGAKLSAIAKEYGLDYDRLHESALAVEEVVDREYLPRFPERRRLWGRHPWKESD